MWWPPGAIECVIAGPGGTTRATTVMPWRDYLSVVLLAGAGAWPPARSPASWPA